MTKIFFWKEKYWKFSSPSMYIKNVPEKLRSVQFIYFEWTFLSRQYILRNLSVITHCASNFLQWLYILSISVSLGRSTSNAMRCICLVIHVCFQMNIILKTKFWKLLKPQNKFTVLGRLFAELFHGSRPPKTAE